MTTLAKAERSFPLLPQEGILQRLQSSVEQEESRWRVKVEMSQGEMKEVCAMRCEFLFLLPNYIVERCNSIFFLPQISDEPESCVPGAGDRETK